MRRLLAIRAAGKTEYLCPPPQLKKARGEGDERLWRGQSSVWHTPSLVIAPSSVEHLPRDRHCGQIYKGQKEEDPIPMPSKLIVWCRLTHDRRPFVRQQAEGSHERVGSAVLANLAQDAGGNDRVGGMNMMHLPSKEKLKM